MLLQLLNLLCIVHNVRINVWAVCAIKQFMNADCSDHTECIVREIGHEYLIYLHKQIQEQTSLMNQGMQTCKNNDDV